MRAIINLTTTQRAHLAMRKKKESNNKIYRRYLYLEMSSEGMTNIKIAKLLGVCNDTLTVWKQIYEEAGLEGLAQLHYEGRRISKLEEHKEVIRSKVVKDNIATLKQIQGFLKKECHVTVEHSWLYRFCKKTQSLL